MLWCWSVHCTLENHSTSTWQLHVVKKHFEKILKQTNVLFSIIERTGKFATLRATQNPKSSSQSFPAFWSSSEARCTWILPCGGVHALSISWKNSRLPLQGPYQTPGQQPLAMCPHWPAQAKGLLGHKNYSSVNGILFSAFLTWVAVVLIWRCMRLGMGGKFV